EAAAYRGFAEMLGITPYLERALADKLAPSFTPRKSDAGH
ncbi:MAG: hypothetical protein K0R28_6220, partial [Paenibacillus sp.]|nr:hypothetical protein [Paenibacillus sp.]